MRLPFLFGLIAKLNNYHRFGSMITYVVVAAVWWLNLEVDMWFLFAQTKTKKYEKILYFSYITSKEKEKLFVTFPPAAG